MKEIESGKAWDLLAQNEDAILVDVRGQDEWDIAHPDLAEVKKTAILVTITADFDSFIHKLKEKAPNNEAPILFFCRSGGRSENAATLAEKHGYKDTYNVLGGIIKWVADGLAHANSGEKNA